VITKDKSDKALINNNKDLLINSDTDLLVKNIRLKKAIFIKTKVKLYTFITVNLCYISKNVKISVNILNKKLIKIVKPLK
jgi:hypothetical protein